MNSGSLVDSSSEFVSISDVKSDSDEDSVSSEIKGIFVSLMVNEIENVKSFVGIKWFEALNCIEYENFWLRVKKYDRGKWVDRENWFDWVNWIQTN